MNPGATDSNNLVEFHARAAQFIAKAAERDLTCPAFGAILPPRLFDAARTWQQHCFAGGFAGIQWPEQYGGQGLGAEHDRAWAIECAKRDVAPYMNFQGFVLAGPALLRSGTEDQKQQFLQRTLSADITWCQLFSEPDSGSDLASLSTRATAADDGGWLVTGQKVWSSTAQLADWAILLARTNADVSNHSGISFFLLDMTSPGVEVRPLKQMTGDSEFCEVFLDNAPLAPDQLLGPLNGGWGLAVSVLADERSGAASAGIAMERQMGALRSQIGGASKRDARGPSTNTTRPGVVSADRLLRLHSESNAVQRLSSRSDNDPTLGPLTKLARTELESRITGFAIDALGADGMIESEATEPFLYAPGMRLAGGTSEIQRNLIGERLLGLPREPKADPNRR